MYYLPYNIDLKQFSRRLRKNSTLGEILLWQKLRAGGMMNYTFNRQKPLERYIVDFYCKPLNLVIEIDGSTHDDETGFIKDEKRQTIVEDLGLSFIRFNDIDVKVNMQNVLRTIENYILDYEEANPPSPPLKRGNAS